MFFFSCAWIALLQSSDDDLFIHLLILMCPQHLLSLYVFVFMCAHISVYRCVCTGVYIYVAVRGQSEYLSQLSFTLVCVTSSFTVLVFPDSGRLACLSSLGNLPCQRLWTLCAIFLHRCWAWKHRFLWFRASIFTNWASLQPLRTHLKTLKSFIFMFL